MLSNFDKKMILTEIVIFFIFLSPITFISFYIGKNQIIYTYLFGGFLSIINTLFLIKSVDWLIKYKLKTMDFFYKKRYKWLYILLFFLRFCLFFLVIAFIVQFPNIFWILVIFLPLSFKTLSSFWVGYRHKFFSNETSLFKHKYFKISDLNE